MDGQFIDFHSKYYPPWANPEFASFNSFEPAPSPPESCYSESASSEPKTEAKRRRPSRPTRRVRPADYVPRPRNSFMIFRSEFCAKRRMTPNIEDDHRIISRIVGHLWRDMPEEEKRQFHVKAELEKLEHKRQYPDYRFTPTVRASKPIKRKVQRNGPEDLERCREVAELLKAGKEGDELAKAVRNLNMEKNHSDLPPPVSVEEIHFPSPASQFNGWQPVLEPPLFAEETYNNLLLSQQLDPAAYNWHHSAYAPALYEDIAALERPGCPFPQ